MKALSSIPIGCLCSLREKMIDSILAKDCLRDLRHLCLRAFVFLRLLRNVCVLFYFDCVGLLFRVRKVLRAMHAMRMSLNGNDA